jgi:putative CocE/NonD family hydrolase
MLCAALLVATGGAVTAAADGCSGAGCMPTPAECADGSHNGVTVDPTDLTRFSVCAGSSGDTAAYVGGSVGGGPCGAVVVADQTLAAMDDPNDCGGHIPGATQAAYTAPMSDGTPIHVDLYRPDGMSEATKAPTILVMTPYANTGGTGGTDTMPAGGRTSNAVKDELATMAQALLSRGYRIAVATVRGFGYSGGCNDFGGVRAQKDVKDVIDWVARQSWSNGHVGMYGMSASAATAVMALGQRPAALDAVVMQSPPMNRYAQAYMNGVPYAVSAEANAAYYAEIGLIPPSAQSDPSQLQEYALNGPQRRGCDVAVAVGSAGSDPTDAFWAERDLTAAASGSNVPVLLSQGVMDSNVKPGSFLPVWSSLRGPHRLWVGQFEHVHGDSDQVGRTAPNADESKSVRPFRDEALRWFDAYVRAVPAELAAVEDDPRVEVERSDGQWRTESQWPLPQVRKVGVSLAAGSYLDVHGNSAEAADPTTTCSQQTVDGPPKCLRTRNGVGSWTFTPALLAAEQISGVPRISVSTQTTQPLATVIALLYDVDAAGQGTLLDRGAARLATAGTSTTTFDLYPQDWYLAAGHRLGVLLTGADDEWFNPVSTGAVVTVTGGQLTLPVLPRVRTTDLSGGPSAAISDRRPITVPQ